MIPRFILIANPNTKRCKLFTQEFYSFWAANRFSPELVIVPWASIVPTGGQLDHLDLFNQPAIVRLESPGKCDDVTRLLLACGAAHDQLHPGTDWANLPLPKGRLVQPHLWFRGFERVLQGLHASLQQRPWLQMTSNPLHCAELFDKTATATRLHQANIPVPAWLSEPHTVAHEVITRRHPYYLKLNTGSNAMGIVVLRNESGVITGTSSLIEIDGQFYNTRRLQHMINDPLQRAIDFILAEGAIAQVGIPMAQIDGQNFDVRVVCLDRQIVACIFRLSSKPMTNLHLGGRRGDEAYCRSVIPKRAWLDALDHCIEAAECYDCGMVGVDLLFARGYQQHYILEVNAFGDFFPNWVNREGRSLHHLELSAIAKRFEQ